MGDHSKKRVAIISVSALVLVAMVVAVTVGVTHSHASSQSDGDDKPNNDHQITASKKAIEAICQPTQFKQNCIDSLSSAAGNTTDPKELVRVAFKVAVKYINAAINRSTTLQQLEKDPRSAQALHNCKELMGYSIDELNQCFDKMGTFDVSKIDELLADLKIWLSAAVTYQETCLDGFQNTTGTAEENMRKALNSSAELTRNSLSIVSEISTVLTSLQIPFFSRRLLSDEQALPFPTEDGFPTWVSAGKRRLLASSVANIKPDLVVAKDGSGKFRTINEALAVVPKKNNATFVIYIKQGVYNEHVSVNRSMTNLMFIGDGPTKTKITGNKNFIDGVNTFKTATVAVIGDGFIAKDIGFENTAGAIKHQAVALRVQSDMSIFYNCQMDGYQDTLYAHAHRQFYRDCTISGTIDFIFGDAAVVFQKCKIVVRKPLDNQQCIVTAQGRKDPKEPTGIVLQGCTITADPLYFPVRQQLKSFLGRPWKEYSRTIIMQSQIDDLIQPEGWLPWMGDFGLKTLFYAEYGNKGPGAVLTKRVKWAGVKTGQLSGASFQQFTPGQFLHGDSWIKLSGVPYTPGMLAGIEDGGSGSGARFHIVQPLRDPQSNWAVDLAKNLEEYLLKICSGEVIDDEDGHLSVNFAEAALLLQGSIQVYSRKVEYLYTLVLHALEFISQKRQEEQPEKTSVQPEGSDNQAVIDEENELFLGLDDVPVEAKNSLDGASEKDDNLNNFVKPPSNLVVLEGDCFDSTGEAGELESYLLSTCDLYQDFILLDPCDAGEVQNFLNGNNAGVGHRGSSVRSKSRKSFVQSPTRISGGTGRKPSFQETQDVNLDRTPGVDCNHKVSDNNISQDPPDCSFPEHDYHGDEMNDGYSEPGDVSEEDDDDPWKPLNPHEPGNLKVKPFQKVKIHRRKKTNSSKASSLATQFPIARLNGTISPEFTEMWEAQLHACENIGESQSSPLYEKLRQSLTNGGNETPNAFGSTEDDEDNDNEHDIPDFEQGDCDMPASTFMDVEEPLNHNKDADDAVHFESTDFGQEDPDSHASLEDLCRSHLDALLASIAETEKQTELAARVTTWKQRIEHTLEDQDSRPPFDIHEYGERIMDKLSLEADSGGAMPFTDVVKGNEKHDVARTFSALLQLVNNGSVDLVRGESSGQTVCYTATNPFSVRLLSRDRRREVHLRSSKKRTKSPMNKQCNVGGREKGDGEKLSKVGSSSLGNTSALKSSQPNGKFSVKLGNVNAVRCTPEGKRRRRSRFIEPVDMQSAG
ncbi:Pectinesterase [Macleaya cordata]|uniref:Condensin-2 complex subunit H2 n=1 Tax=Macleaya cordata TaxID=56857 RepID=A0A200PWM7_MACCD|nr:Pectinesterase [Macleaya cordata]